MGGEYIDKLLKEKAMLDAKLAEKIDAEEEYRESEMRLRNIRDQIEVFSICNPKPSFSREPQRT